MLDYYSLLPYGVEDNEGWTVVSGRRHKRRRVSSSSSADSPLATTEAATTTTSAPPRRKCAKRYWEKVEVEDKNKGQVDEDEVIVQGQSRDVEQGKGQSWDVEQGKGQSRDEKQGQRQLENVTPQGQRQLENVTPQGQRQLENVTPQGQRQLENVTPQGQRDDTSSGGPLSNLVILSTILSFLPLRDIKAARLVSRFWSQVASPRLESLSCLELNLLSPSLGRTPADFWKNVGRLPTSEVKLVRVPSRDGGLVKLMATFGRQIKSLSVDAVACGDGEMGVENDVIQKNFFLQISHWCPFLESLHLANLPSSLVEGGFPPLMRVVMVDACPSLRSLSISCSSYYSGLDANFLLDLLDFAPNLTSLAFHLEDDDALEEVFTALEFRPRRVATLEALSFGGSTLYEAQIAVLASLELHRNLRSLNLGKIGLDVVPEDVTDLMKKVGGSLKRLRVEGAHSNCPLHLPELPELVELVLDHVVDEEELPASKFFNGFPNLKKCTLGGRIHYVGEIIEEEEL